MTRDRESGETIVGPAIRDNGVVYSLPAPNRHHHIFAQHCITRPDGIIVSGIAGGDQGFVTSAGRYVDRKEGMKIATAAGQVKRYSGPSDTLFTEDMW